MATSFWIENSTVRERSNDVRNHLPQTLILRKAPETQDSNMLSFFNLIKKQTKKKKGKEKIGLKRTPCYSTLAV